jgi:hypothetical protein
MKSLCGMALLVTYLGISCGVQAAGLPRSSFFVANEGQWEGQFAFRYEGKGAMWYITPEGMTVDFRQYEGAPQRRREEPWQRAEETEPVRVRGHVVKMSYVGANPSWEITGEDKLPHYSNYFYGSDSCRWRSRVGHYQRVTAKNVWPGVDIEYRIAAEGIESVYHLAAGVDPAVIRIRYEGLDAPLRMDSEGNLVLKTSLGEVREKAPTAWQVWQGRREEVGIAFQVTGESECLLWCPGYDRQLPLVIDPLLYGGMLGGGWGRDDIWDVYIASDGSIVVGGHTSSNDFPVTPGAYQGQRRSLDGFVTKLTADGDSLLLSTYLGRTGETNVWAVCATSDGSVWVGGTTESSSWPLTVGAFDSVFAGGNEGFLMHLSADGTTLLFSSFLGAGQTDTPRDMDLDSIGRLYVVGETGGLGFPLTADALFPAPTSSMGNGFLSVLDVGSTQLVYSSYLTCNDYVGVSGCRVASPGRLWMWGMAGGTDFPVTADALQPQNNTDSSLSHRNEGFFLLWNLNENRLEYSSYFGSRGYDAILGLWVWDSTRIVLGGDRLCRVPADARRF